jgi:hypothetical protein
MEALGRAKRDGPVGVHLQVYDGSGYIDSGLGKLFSILL